MIASPSEKGFALAAMSGGVDSSVVAALLLEAGWEVAGVTLRLADDPDPEALADKPSCCAPDDIADARRVCQRLDIPHYVLDYRKIFEAAVITPFVERYAAGQTPNPCVLCNERVKFEPLLERARSLGAQVVATGHYAQIKEGPEGRRRLLRGADPKKDQSYFLYGLDQQALGSLVFPLGAMTKDEVRARADAAGLPTAQKPDSQEICFVGPAGHVAFLESRGVQGRGGDIVHLDGRRLGTHEGNHRYTVGQRRGLRVAAAEPLYVLETDRAGDVVVGPRAALDRRRLVIDAPRWVSGEAPSPGEALTIQVRYRDRGTPGRLVELDQGRALVELDQPVQGAAPGQATVLYAGDEVLGGGPLREALP